MQENLRERKGVLRLTSRTYLPAFNDIGGTFAHSEGRCQCHDNTFGATRQIFCFSLGEELSKRHYFIYRVWTFGGLHAQLSGDDW